MTSGGIVTEQNSRNKPIKTKKTVIPNQFKIVRTTMTRGFSQMHLETILIGYFNLSAFTVCISLDKPKIFSQ